MFKLDSVFLFALDVVKGPYVHCSAPQGNGVAADVLAVATPLRAGTPVVWEAKNTTGAPSGAIAGLEASSPCSPTTAAARATRPDIKFTEKPRPPASPTRTTASPACTVEREDASAESRFAGLSDVFIPRSEFSRRVLWLYPAETRLLYLYYPEEIPGDHYPRKTLRYSLCMAFQVDTRMVTVGEQLLNRLVQPYSMVLINVAEELRNAEVRYGYMSRGLEGTLDNSDRNISATFSDTDTLSPAAGGDMRGSPPMGRSSMRIVLPSQFPEASSSAAKGPQGPRQGTFPAVLPSEHNTPTVASSRTPGSAPSPLSNATFTSAMRASGIPMRITNAHAVADTHASLPPPQAESQPRQRQGACQHSALTSASTTSLPTPWTTAASMVSTSSSDARCLNCFVTPTLAQSWVSLQDFFNAWYSGLTQDAHERGPSTGQDAHPSLPASATALSGNGGTLDKQAHSSFTSGDDRDVAEGRSSPTTALASPSPGATGAITREGSSRAVEDAQSTSTTTAPHTSVSVSQTHLSVRTSPVTTTTTHTYSSFLPRHPSSTNNVQNAFRGSTDAMMSVGAELESTVYSPLVTYPKEKYAGSWDRLNRSLVGADDTQRAGSSLAAGDGAEPDAWSTQRLIDATPALRQRWQLIQQLSVVGTSACGENFPKSPATTGEASTTPSTPPSTPAAAHRNRQPAMLHLSDSIGFHVRRMAPPTPVKEVPLGFVPVLISAPSPAQLEKMDLAVQRVLRLIDGEHSVADIVFQLTFHTASGLYEVCHAAATQSPQLFSTLAEPGSTAVTSGVAAYALSASPPTHKESLLTATVVHGSGATRVLDSVACATGSAMASQGSPTPRTRQGGMSARSPLVSTTASSGASLDTAHEADGCGALGATKDTHKREQLYVSSMLVQLRKLPQPSALFTQWAPTPVVRVTVRHTAPRPLAGAARGSYGSGVQGISPPMTDTAGVTDTDGVVLFRTVLPIAAGDAFSSPSMHRTSPYASAAAGHSPGWQGAMSPLQLAASHGQTPASHAKSSPSSQCTPASGNFCSLPRAAAASGNSHACSPLSLPTVDVLRVTVDLPHSWHEYVSMVTEALLQLERCGMARLLQPWAPHTTYRTTPRFQALLADRQHPARNIIGKYLLKCAARSRQARQQHRQRGKPKASDAESRGGANAQINRSAENGASTRMPPLSTAPTLATATAACDNDDGGEVAHPDVPAATLAPKGSPHSSLTATFSQAGHSAETPSHTMALSAVHFDGGWQRQPEEAVLAESLRSGHGGSVASRLCHSVTYGADGGMLQLSLARPPAADRSQPVSPTVVISSSLGTHRTGFMGSDDRDDTSSMGTSARLGPLAHTLLPMAEPAFLAHSLPSVGTVVDLLGTGGAPVSEMTVTASRAERTGESSGITLADLYDIDDSAVFPQGSEDSFRASDVSSSSSSMSSSSLDGDDGDFHGDEGRSEGDCAREASSRKNLNARRARDAATPHTVPDHPQSARTTAPEKVSEAEVRATASAALCALAKLTNSTIHRMCQEMRWMPTWSAALDGWSAPCCRALVELALLNDWVEVVL